MQKDPHGPVTYDASACVGCRYCMMACPYKARSFIHENIQLKSTAVPRGKGCVESCNFCAHRLDAGDISTACADACSQEGHQAIVFGYLGIGQGLAPGGFPAVASKVMLQFSAE